MSEENWFRVIDPINPLFGCDVKTDVHPMLSSLKYVAVRALRRIDVVLGDRPYQLIAPEGQTLGLRISTDHLGDCALQDEVVEFMSDRPFGLCISESEMTRFDRHVLRIAVYETATQVALADPDGNLLGSRTFYGRHSEPRVDGESLVELFANDGDPDLITALLRRS